MEVYLSHMIMFRVIERIGLNRIIGDGWLQYVVTVILTVCGAIIFSVVIKKGLEIAEKKVSQKTINRVTE